MSNDIEAIENELEALGLCCVGRSRKSKSSYWSLSNDDDMPRIRVSDHAVVYPESDCVVCVGNSPDDDFPLQAGVGALAASKLVLATIDHERAWQLETSEHETEVDARNAADAREAWVRQHWGRLIVA